MATKSKADHLSRPVADMDLLMATQVREVATYRLTTLVNRLNRQATIILKEEAGLRLPEWRCLALLGDFGTLSVAELTKLYEMDKALISRTVQDLVRKGYVITARPAHDRRVLKVRLSAAGKRKYDATLPIMRERLSKLLAHIEQKEYETLMTVIDKLNLAYFDWATAKNGPDDQS